MAAHITGASPGGPRYDPSLTSEERTHARNGIWLCETCAKLVDSDVARYTPAILRAWKALAEAVADTKVGKTETRPPSAIIQNLYVEQVNVTVYSNREPLVAAPPATPPTELMIVENGGFEQGTDGWGTGFYESYFASPEGSALLFSHAVARWYIDDQRAHGGQGRALRVEHDTTNTPHVFSSFTQRIKVERGQRYEVKYWAYVEALDGPGGFSLRVLPSRRTEPSEWDRFRKKINPAVRNQWQEVRFEFESGRDSFFDLRFTAETTLKLWVDDVSVTLIDGSGAPGGALGRSG